eukprot:14032206-Alexandrium_andersonii.AAC.1
MLFTDTDLGDEAAVAHHQHSIELTCTFVRDLGAVLEVKKSHSSANTPGARARLKRCRYGEDRAPIP